MNIGEFFVNLGVKGADKTVEAIGGVKDGLGKVAGMSLEAKAAIIGAMYALERTFAASGAAGTGLTNFNALLGVSTKTLQQYQYAARQMGVTNEDVEASFRGIQAAMSRTLMGEGAPKGMARMAAMTGGVTPEDIIKWQKQPELLMKKLQEYSMKEKNTGLRNEVLKSFGMSDSMIAAMTRNAFNPAALGRAPVYSEKEIGALDRANIAWSNLGQKIEMAVGHFNAKHGQQLVHDISKMVESVMRLVEAFTKLAEALHLFEGLDKVIGGMADFINKTVTLFGGTDKDKDKMAQKTIDLMKSKDTRPLLEKWGLIGGKPEPVVSPAAIAPSPPASPLPSGTTQNINVKQTLQFSHEGKDADKTGESVRKAIQDHFRQTAAQGQGS